MKLKQRGALIIEYVIILPFMIFLIMTAVYLSIAFHDYNALNEVAREAARLGVIGNKDEDIKNAAIARSSELLTRLYAVEGTRVRRITKTKLNNEKYLEFNISARKVPEHSVGLIDRTLPDTIGASVRMRVEVDPKDLPDNSYTPED